METDTGGNRQGQIMQDAAECWEVTIMVKCFNSSKVLIVLMTSWN